MIQGFSNAIGRMVDWTVDSSWGLSYWHSLGFKCLESRFAPPIVSLFCILGSHYFHNEHNKNSPQIQTAGKLFNPMWPMFLTAFLWETKLLSRPLDGATMRTILAHTAVAGIDSFSAFGLVESDRRVAKGLSAGWLLYRLLDVALASGTASHGLVRLNFDPTFDMAHRLAFWAPN